MRRSVHRVAYKRVFDVYIGYAYALLYKGEFEAAEQALLKGLRLNAWDFDAQIRLAELELRSGREHEAYERLMFVVLRSENAEQRGYAERLIRTHNLAERSKSPVLPSRFEYRLLVLPIGEVHEVFLDAIRSRLAEEFHVSVEIMPAVALPTEFERREVFAGFLDQVIRLLERENSPEAVRTFYGRLGLTPLGPRTREEKERVVRALTYGREDGEQVWEHMQWQYSDQVEALELLEYVSKQ